MTFFKRDSRSRNRNGCEVCVSLTILVWDSMYRKLTRKFNHLASKYTCIIYAMSPEKVGDKHENDNGRPISFKCHV